MFYIITEINISTKTQTNIKTKLNEMKIRIFHLTYSSQINFGSSVILMYLD